jgi:hypothetical protein
MNRRKFFAGLALVPALPVAAATAATNEPDVHGYFVTEEQMASIEASFDKLAEDLVVAEEQFLAVMSEVHAGRMSANEARASLTLA